MGRFVDLTGKTFGRLTVTGFSQYKKRPDGRNNGYWKCSCQCGKESEVSTGNLRSGAVRSCGCLTVERVIERKTVHGFRKRNEKMERLYNIWNCMKTRCYNKTREDYELYGGRGITVCDEWLHDFSAFRKWSLANGYDESLTLDRIDANGDYCPENCRWADKCTQARNQRISRTNKTGYAGVQHRGNKFTAYIIVNGKHLHLGTFATIEEAAKVRRDAELKYWGWTKIEL